MKKHILQLQAENFKGRTINVELAPLTIITGDNFKGKSAHMDAIRLALLGNIPEIGKKNDATFELASGVRMSVGVTFNTGETISREFWRDGDSIRSAGPKEVVTIPLLNAMEYFEMTETQRMDYIASRLELKGAKKAGDILKELSEILKDAPGDVLENIYNWVSSVLDGKPVADGLTDLIDKKRGVLSGKFTTWNAEKTNSIGAVRKLADLHNMEGECSAETLATRRQNVEAAQKAVEAAVKRQGELAQAAMRANQDKERKAELERTIEYATVEKIDMPKAPVFAEDLAALKRTLADHEAKISEQQPSQLAALRDRMNDIKLTDSRLYSEYKSFDEQLSSSAEALDELATHQACPYCKSKAKGWKARVQTILEKERDDVKKQSDAACAKFEENKLAIEALWKEIDAEEKLDRARTGAETVRLGLKQKIEQQERTLAAYGQARDKAVARQESATREHSARIGAAKEALKHLQIAQVDQQALEKAADVTAEAKARLGEAQADLEKSVQVQQDLARAVQSEEAHQLACAYVEAITVACKFLKTCQEENITNVFQSLLVNANFYTDGIMLTPLDFHQGEVVRFQNGRPIYHRTFSGVEKMVTYVSIAASLSEKSDGPRVVLIDEFNRATPKYQAKIMERLAAAVKDGRIDQVIILAPSEQSVIVNGWENIHLA